MSSTQRLSASTRRAAAGTSHTLAAVGRHGRGARRSWSSPSTRRPPGTSLIAEVVEDDGRETTTAFVVRRDRRQP